MMDTSYLEQQVATIIGKLHELFDEIGVPSHERDTRESELFSALSETLHNQLRLVANEKHEMAEEASRLITTIRQMETSLDGANADRSYHDNNDRGLTVTYPLTRCLQTLKEKHSAISKLHRERFEQVRRLVEALESYSSHIESSFVKLQLPPTSPGATISASFDLSPNYVTALDNEFTRVYEEYNRRREHVKALAEEIVMLWAELGTPQAQTDEAIVEHGRDAPEQLGLHQDDIARLKGRRDKLVEEKKAREKRLKDLRTTIEDLWDRLGVDDGDRKAFLSANRGCGLRTINEFEDELSRLNELKRQNLHLFVEDARFRLQELWDGLYFSEEEMLDFTPAFSDVYSDALLSAHEAEIKRLEALKEQRAPTLAMVDRHRTLVRERDELANSSQDASRLMSRGHKGERRDPGKLLREEKMRKRIAKELPKVEAELRRVLEDWEDEYGRPFLVHGQRYLDELAAAASAKPAPPRAKTPNALPPPARPGTAMGRPASAKQAGGSVRGPPRSKTPCAPPASFSKSVSAATAPRTSPSKIPSRAPLSNMPHGNNSPERRGAANANNAAFNGRDTMRKMMGPPPARAPPPKMKDLFVPPTPVPAAQDQSLVPRSGSIVRHVAPEDPYEDPRFANRPASRVDSAHGGGHGSMSSSSNSSSYFGHRATPSAPASLSGSMIRNRPESRLQNDWGASSRYGSMAGSMASLREAPESRAASRPESRVMSNNSSVSAQSGYTNPTTVSGSENWETYDSASELGEPEGGSDGAAADAYYARLRAATTTTTTGYGSNAAAGVKRTVVGYASPRLGKRTRGELVMEVRAEDGRTEMVSVRESEQSWEDEEGYA